MPTRIARVASCHGIKMLMFFLSCQRVRDREYNMANIVPFSTNQIADILYVRDNVFCRGIYIYQEPLNWKS